LHKIYFEIAQRHGSNIYIGLNLNRNALPPDNEFDIYNYISEKVDQEDDKIEIYYSDPEFED
jgi:hypothetical protein